MALIVEFLLSLHLTRQIAFHLPKELLQLLVNISVRGSVEPPPAHLVALGG